MNCEVAHERIVTAAYGELHDNELHELERHVDGCSACQAEREQVLALKVLAAALPVEEPEANLIARARLRLDEALDGIPPRRWYERLGQQMRNGFASLQSAPVAALLVLALGAGAGAVGGMKWTQRHSVAPATTASAAAVHQPVAGISADATASGEAASQADDTAPAMASVAGISGIKRQPNGEMVDVSYNQLVPRHVQGSLDDPKIRQLLMLASKNSTSSQVRDDSVSLLAAECRAGHSCKPAGIRDALMAALLYDKNAGVREKALEGLEPYVAQDVRVRNAVLEALLNDSDPKIRTASINLLEPVEADTSVRQVLYSVSTSDDSPQIRNVSRQILSQVPEIQ
jgi:hypothetical protein